MALREHYWNPRLQEQSFVNERRFIYAFNRHQGAGTWSDLHVHADWGELTYVSSGSIVLCTGSGNFSGNGYRGVWVPPGLQHEWYMPEACNNRSLFIHVSALEELPRFRAYHAVEMPMLLRELIIAMGNEDVDFETEAGVRLARVLLDRLQRTKEVGMPLLMPSDHQLVELCVEALAMPGQPVRLSDWSERLNVSEKTLERLFIRQTGQTFGKWVQNMRMQSALADLSKGDDVTTAAVNCGYSSVSAFISAFKKQFGTTPGALSKQVKTRQC